MTQSAAYWLEKLGLSLHPEGGYFRQTYRSPETVERDHLPQRYCGPRSFSTAIYFLLEGGQFSALHRLKSDEIWHFYAGSSLTLYRIDGDGSLSAIRLGSDFENGEVFQAFIPSGCWFGAIVNDPASFSLVGCTVAPGFDFDDFEMGDRAKLLELYPQHQEIIIKLTEK